jgi:sugar lactone lactonase YvrE
VYGRIVRKFAIVLLAFAVLLVACGGASTAAPPKKQAKPLRLGTPGPIALAPDGTLVVGDRELRRVLRINPRTKKRTLVVSGFPSEPVGLGYDDMRRLYVSAGDRVYRIDRGRKVLVAGTGTRGHSGDGGRATTARLSGAGGIDVDHDESIAIAEYDNWIRVVAPDGTIRSVAGNGGTGYAGDGGPATEALLGHPHDVIWRRDGVLLIADSHNGVIRRVDANGRISTFASGFFAPIALEGGPGDTVYVSDARPLSIYRLGPDGGDKTLVATVPGTPVGLAVDANHNVYATELEGRKRVVRIAPGGRTTVLATGTR